MGHSPQKPFDEHCGHYHHGHLDQVDNDLAYLLPQWFGHGLHLLVAHLRPAATFVAENKKPQEGTPPGAPDTPRPLGYLLTIMAQKRRIVY
jgi:hypothetical protein